MPGGRRDRRGGDSACQAAGRISGGGGGGIIRLGGGPSLAPPRLPGRGLARDGVDEHPAPLRVTHAADHGCGLLPNDWPRDACHAAPNVTH